MCDHVNIWQCFKSSKIIIFANIPPSPPKRGPFIMEMILMTRQRSLPGCDHWKCCSSDKLSFRFSRREPIFGKIYGAKHFLEKKQRYDWIWSNAHQTDGDVRLVNHSNLKVDNHCLLLWQQIMLSIFSFLIFEIQNVLSESGQFVLPY